MFTLTFCLYSGVEIVTGAETMSRKETAEAYTLKLAGALNGLRKEKELCDIIITIGERSFPAHRAVLAASSRYFKAMLTSGFKESSADKVNIDGDPEVFECLLEFAYTGDLIVPTAKKAYQVLQMASYLQVLDASEPLRSYVESHNIACCDDGIPIEDMYSMYKFAHSDDFKDVAEASLWSLCCSVDKLRQADRFLQSDITFLEVFLQEQDLGTEHDEIKVM